MIQNFSIWKRARRSVHVPRCCSSSLSDFPNQKYNSAAASLPKPHLQITADPYFLCVHTTVQHHVKTHYSYHHEAMPISLCLPTLLSPNFVSIVQSLRAMTKGFEVTHGKRYHAETLPGFEQDIASPQLVS